MGSIALSEFRTSLSKVLTIWHCDKVKQRYHNPFKTQNSNWNNHIFVIIYKVCCPPAQKMLQKSSILTPCHESWWDEGGVAATSPLYACTPSTALDIPICVTIWNGACGIHFSSQICGNCQLTVTDKLPRGCTQKCNKFSYESIHLLFILLWKFSERPIL